MLGRMRPYVHLPVEIHQVDRSGRAGPLAQQPRPPAFELAIAVGTGGPQPDADRSAPLFVDQVPPSIQGLAGNPLRVVLGIDHSRVGPAEDERGNPVRVGGGEEGRHRPALRDSYEGRAPAGSRFHHRLQVAHRLLQARRVAGPVGKPLAALVEDDQPREGGQAAQKARRRRILPQQLDVGDEARHQDQVERTFAVHLVGDVDSVGVGVAGERFHLATRNERSGIAARRSSRSVGASAPVLVVRLPAAPPARTRRTRPGARMRTTAARAYGRGT